MAADNNTTDAPPSLGPVLVTGGCGFIGSHIVEGIRTLYPEVDVHVLDLNIDRYRIFGATYHKCDLSNAAEVEAVFLKAKPKTVFHTACPDSMVVKPEIFKRVNVDGTHNMVAACRKVGTVQAFVNTSTSSVIHDNVSDLIDAGDDLPVLKYPVQKRIYTLTKAEGEAIILAANRSDGDASMLTVTLRPASVFGERDHVCMGKIVDSCRAGRGRFQIGPGKNLYDFAYVGNVVHAHILSAQALLRAYGKPAPPADKRVDGQAFNVTNDERWLFWDFQRAVSASVGLPVKPEEIKVVPIWAAKLAAGISEWTTWFRTFGKGHPPVSREAVHLTTIHRTMNGDKIRDRLGYKPKYSIQEGLDRAGKWFVEEAKREAAEKEKKEGVNQ